MAGPEGVRLKESPLYPVIIRREKATRRYRKSFLSRGFHRRFFQQNRRLSCKNCFLGNSTSQFDQARGRLRRKRENQYKKQQVE